MTYLYQKSNSIAIFYLILRDIVEFFHFSFWRSFLFKIYFRYGPVLHSFLPDEPGRVGWPRGASSAKAWEVEKDLNGNEIRVPLSGEPASGRRGPGRGEEKPYHNSIDMLHACGVSLSHGPIFVGRQFHIQFDNDLPESGRGVCVHKAYVLRLDRDYYRVTQRSD